MAEIDGEQRAWVKRVLGVDVGADASSAPDVNDLLDLKNRLAEATRAIAKLKADGDPAVVPLTTALSAAAAAYQGNSATAGPLVDTVESDLALALSRARSREAAKVGAGKVEYGKLLLRWRSALSGVQSNLKALGEALLADPEVQEDEHYEQIEDAVAELPDLIPDFGGVLDDLLTQAGRPGADVAALHREALETLAEYREELAESPELKELEPFAAQAGLGQFLLFSEFDAALKDVEGSIRKAL